MGEWTRYLQKQGLAGDVLAGGKADGKPNSDFSAEQLAEGQKVEKEHTNSDELAAEISRDHLEEIPDYYTRLKEMEDEAKKQKVAFGLGPEIQVPAELLSTVGGLYAGYPAGKSLAGQAAAGIAPHGKMLRTEEKARRAAMFTGPAAGIAALALARKYGLAGKAANYLARKAPRGLIANPQLEQEAVRMATPFVAGLGGSMAGGLGTGAVLGAASHLGGSEKKEKTSAVVRNRYTGETMIVPTDKAYEAFKKNPPGFAERNVAPGAAALGTGLGAGAAAVLARRAGLKGLGTAATAALGGLGGGSFGLLGGSAAKANLQRTRLNQEWDDLSKHKINPQSSAKPAPEAPMKQASLNQALGSLYVTYGPPLQKHAAATFFNYTVDKDGLDQEALGAQFCKIARASRIDPWQMALKVVESYPNIEKMAAAKPSKEQELASFYVNWGDEMLKKADLVGALASVPKAIGGAFRGARQGIRGGVAEAKAVQQAGGGSYLRGRKLVKADPQLMNITKNPVVHQGPPPAAGGGPAPTPKPKSRTGDYVRGAAVLGGLGLGGAAVAGGGQQQPAYGESYA